MLGPYLTTLTLLLLSWMSTQVKLLVLSLSTNQLARSAVARSRYFPETSPVTSMYWSGRSFVPNHPDGWITDPVENFAYTTHGYWGHYHYSCTYDEDNAYWSSKGY